MPRAPRHCGIKGCTVIVPAGKRCPQHQHGWGNSPRTASSGRTGTSAWKVQRAKALQRDQHQGQIRGPRCTVQATEVDHVIPSTSAVATAWVISKALATLAIRHAQRHRREQRADDVAAQRI
jgi:5-methylcytosine-specific restriction enzyme A